MKQLILKASDRGPMFINPIASGEWLHITQEDAVATINDLLSVIRENNPRVVIMNLIYTIGLTHKVDLYYAIKRRFEISPMGHLEQEYDAISQLRHWMPTHFSKLEYPQ